MKTVIVPESLSNEINKAIEEAALRAGMNPAILAEEREEHYAALLSFFNEHGFIPSFDFEPKDGRRLQVVGTA